MPTEKLMTQAQAQEAREYYWPNGHLKWGCPIDVGHLILQLQTLDPKMKVSSVMHIPREGMSNARAYGLSMSLERWDEGGWLDYSLPVDESVALWAYERKPELRGLNPLDPAAMQDTIDALAAVLRKVREAGHAAGCRSLTRGDWECNCPLREVERVLQAFELATRTSEGTGAASGRSEKV